MVNERQTILQIVPRLPDENDGVSDYARTLAQKLLERWNIETRFATADSALTQKDFPHVILHYVNYGYQKRGVPFGLLSILRKVRERSAGEFVTIFHELYASGRAVWESAFWLRPFQMQIARSIARLSDRAIVSSETMLRQLQRLQPGIDGSIHPVFSNFGEPTFSRDQFANRSSHRWVICGGTALIERSLRSFCATLDRIPETIAPRELFVIGGKEIPAVRALVAAVSDRRKHPRSMATPKAFGAATMDIRIEYRPQIAVPDASQILSSCAFGWLDYFHRLDVPMDVVLKSSVFAALCAHGVIPIFPYGGTAISTSGDRLPGPFFVDPSRSDLPATDARAGIADEFYRWYNQHAASAHLAHTIAIMLGLDSARD